MANNKVGFNYYNSDTDRYQDIKIKRLKKEFKCDGISVYDYILNEVYRIKGCYLEWDENVAFDIADYWGLGESRVADIVNFCCAIGLFNEGIFEKHKVITSRSIQERFKTMSLKSKRSEVKIPEEWDIIREECGKTTEECTQNSDSLPQSKVKESKVKESKVDKSKGEKEGTREANEFLPPSLVDVKNYLEKKGWDAQKSETEAAAFIDYYGKTNWQTANGLITKWENAANGWIRNDGKFEKENKPGRTGSKKHPDHWSKTWELSLSTEQMKEYWQHLRNLGFVTKKDGAQNVIGWHKPSAP